MKTNFLLLFIMLTARLFSQNYFNRLYNYDSYGNFANTGYEYNNGDYLIAGQKTSVGGIGSLYFIRINSLGDTIYSKRYPKLNHYRYCGASGSLIKSLDNNLILSGADLDSSFSYNALLVKLTEAGDTLWTKTYGGANFDNANIVHQTADSGFVLMGVTQSFSVGTASDFYMIRTDKNGNFLWQKTYGTSATEDCVSGQITLDGGFILSGHRNDQLHIVKTDSAGNFQWEKVYPGTAGQGFIKQLADSSYILVGAKYITASVYKAYMAKLTKTGNIIWQNTYGGVGNQQFYAIPIVLNDGSIVCSGASINSSVWGMLVKVDSLGNQQWLRTYYANSSGNNYVYDVKHTSDNGFIMVGSGNVSGQDAWVVKVDEFGCEVSNCNVGVEEYKGESSIISVYPNPSNSVITIITNEPTQIKIINMLGEVVLEKQVQNQEIIDIKNLSSGIYFIQTKEGYSIKLIKN
jgi:hypothetical protein